VVIYEAVEKGDNTDLRKVDSVILHGIQHRMGYQSPGFKRYLKKSPVISREDTCIGLMQDISEPV